MTKYKKQICTESQTLDTLKITKSHHQSSSTHLNIEVGEFPYVLQEWRIIFCGFHEKSEKHCVSSTHIELCKDK